MDSLSVSCNIRQEITDSIKDLRFAILSHLFSFTLLILGQGEKSYHHLQYTQWFISSVFRVISDSLFTLKSAQRAALCLNTSCMIQHKEKSFLFNEADISVGGVLLIFCIRGEPTTDTCFQQSDTLQKWQAWISSEHWQAKIPREVKEVKKYFLEETTAGLWERNFLLRAFPVHPLLCAITDQPDLIVHSFLP